jgi:hypothetical protein
LGIEGDPEGEDLGERERRTGEGDLDISPEIKDGMDGTDLHLDTFCNGFTEGKTLKFLAGLLVGVVNLSPNDFRAFSGVGPRCLCRLGVSMVSLMGECDMRRFEGVLIG